MPPVLMRGRAVAVEAAKLLRRLTVFKALAWLIFDRMLPVVEEGAASLDEVEEEEIAIAGKEGGETIQVEVAVMEDAVEKAGRRRRSCGRSVVAVADANMFPKSMLLLFLFDRLSVIRSTAAAAILAGVSPTVPDSHVEAVGAESTVAAAGLVRVAVLGRCTDEKTSLSGVRLPRRRVGRAGDCMVFSVQEE